MGAHGTCLIQYCLDLARGVDLERAQSRLHAWRRAAFSHKSRVLTGDGVLPPLRIRLEAEGVELVSSIGNGVPTAADGVDDAASGEPAHWKTDPSVELALYDLGALCVTWRIPIESELEDLVGLSAALYENPTLTERSRALAVDLLETLGDAASSPEISPLIEDYVIFELTDLGLAVEPLSREARATVARVLRAERDPLSEQEIENALSDLVAYRAGEACYIDWLAAVLCGSTFEDERLVLELATVELLGLRILDAQLDGEIRGAYDLMKQPHRAFAARSKRRHEMERVGRMQADGAVLHEGIDNALKLLGDDYLARLYRTAAERFHFNDWDASIERKLGVLRNVYENLEGAASHRRSEILEWIIILLIAIDIVLYFTPLR